ncbi:MAG: phospholipase D-like domain-containing protein, partial [Bacteriovorax sp.]
MEHNFFHLSRNNHVEFIQDSPRYYEEFLNLIKNAKTVIHLQTYIFTMDEFGSLVHAELINAIQRKVQVYLLIDSVGSRFFDQKAEQELVNAGVNFLRFNSIQIKWLYSWGRRLHHKILLVDQEASLIGGINVNSTINKMTNSYQLDFAVFLKGPVILRLSQYCQMIYKMASRKKVHFPPLIAPQSYPEGSAVKLLVNDWVYRRWQITKHYTHLAEKAREEITIINSYFFPRRTFMKQLVAAAKRGVRVRLILPKYSDWPSYILASEFLYDYFLKGGVEIYQWNKSILHGKLATIDDHWATIGSFNLNYTSYQQNLEMNVNVYSKEFASELKKNIDTIIKEGCDKLDARTFVTKSPLKIRIERLFYYIVLSVVANFSIGLIYQEDNNKENRFYNLLRIVGSLFFFILGILGLILPLMPGIPFLCISFFLVYK